jgi:hypothetical protein
LASTVVEGKPSRPSRRQTRFILNPAVEANRQAEIHLESTRASVSAQAETHGKQVRRQRFFSAWIPAFAGMTAECVRRPAIALPVMLKNSGHAVSPNVFASWAKATAGFRINPALARAAQDPLTPTLSRKGRGGAVACSAFTSQSCTVQHCPFSHCGRRTG